MAKNFVAGASHPGQMEREGVTSAPRKVHSGETGRRGGGRREDCCAIRRSFLTHRQVCRERRLRRDRGGATVTVAASRVFTHRTVATARNRASGFGGDWRVRQQLPVGVGPDDRMPPGSREPKWAQQKTARNGDSVTEYHTCSRHTAIHYLLTGKPGRQRLRRCPPRFRQASACQGFSRGLTGGLHRLPLYHLFLLP